MAVLTAADFEAIVDSGIATATIEAVIAREEAALEWELHPALSAAGAAAAAEAAEAAR